MYKAIIITVFALLAAVLGYVFLFDPLVGPPQARTVPDATTTTTTYTCPEGTDLVVTVAEERVQLVAGGETYNLTRTRSTGTRFASADGSVVLSVEAGVARLTVGGEVRFEECTVSDGTPEESEPTATSSELVTFTSDPLPEHWRFTFEHPEAVSSSQVSDSIYEFKLIGPESELNSEITDGLYVSVRAERASGTLGDYVERREPAGPITPASFQGYRAFRYTTISALSDDEVERLSFALPSATPGPVVIDISYDTYDDENGRYREIIDEMLGSFEFERGTDADNFDVIRVDLPQPGATTTSPLTIAGEARGTWYSEGQFPVLLTDAAGTELASGVATAGGEWMTESYVPFTAELTWDDPAAVSGPGALVFERANPSGLSENAEALTVPVRVRVQ